MLLRQRSAARPSGFVEPCRPSRTPRPPSGPLWIHEIKHDGFRLMVRREGARVRLWTRGGYTDWADRFPAIVEAASRLRTPSFLIDGEAVICRDDGISDFDALRSRRRDHDVTLIAFDLIEWQGDDLRNHKLIDRKNRLAKMLARGGAAIRFNEHLAHDGPAMFEHACRGLRGLFQSGSTRRIAADRQRRGLSRKIRSARRCGASARKIGIRDSHQTSVAILVVSQF
jgi:bifunctional non-homologous end joining protein LigD